MDERTDASARFINHQSDRATLSVPGTARTVISVAAVSKQAPFALTAFSSQGPCRDGRRQPDIAAPGQDILAAMSGTHANVVVMSGTSMAAPHVTGAITLLFSAWEKRREQYPNMRLPRLSASQVRGALIESAQAFSGSWNPQTGYGILDAEALLKAFR